jgi:hypothetical protein
MVIVLLLPDDELVVGDVAGEDDALGPPPALALA